jgi:hypothetical protein
VPEGQFEWVADVAWVPTDANVADLFAKPFRAPKLHAFRAVMSLS